MGGSCKYANHVVNFYEDTGLQYVRDSFEYICSETDEFECKVRAGGQGHRILLVPGTVTSLWRLGYLWILDRECGLTHSLCTP